MITCPQCGAKTYLVTRERYSTLWVYRLLLCLDCRYEWYEEKKIGELW